MRNNVCPKCNSPEIIPDVEIRDYSANSYKPLSVAVQPTRSSVEKNPQSGEMRAWICGQCGFTEIYTVGFAELALD